MSSKDYFHLKLLENNTYEVRYENNVFVGVIYRESHGEWVITLEPHSGYVAAHHLMGIAAHLQELNWTTYTKEMMEFKDEE